MVGVIRSTGVRSTAYGVRSPYSEYSSIECVGFHNKDSSSTENYCIHECSFGNGTMPTSFVTLILDNIFLVRSTKSRITFSYVLLVGGGQYY
jgi:hypothetical protein